MHKHMAFNIEECVEMSHLKQKVTAIVPTCCAHINFLLWSVFSLLLRSKPNGILEHICVNINGPDQRTGDTTNQDDKQKFLTELRDIQWYHAADPANKRQMPLTVIRAWSRVGWAESLEMALPWIHTDAYMFMHDDVMVLKPEWQDEVVNKFYADDNVALAHCGPLLGSPCDHAIHRGMYLARLPQVETTFLVCKKKWVMKAQAPWTGYHIPSDDNVLQFDLSEVGDIEEFFSFWRKQGVLKEPFMKTELYNFVRQELGAWVYYKLYQNGHKFNELDPSIMLHFDKMSRYEPFNAGEPNPKTVRVMANSKAVEALEQEIEQHPEYAALYNKYKKEF